jgi:uncharacterized protein (TIGR03435 family)
MEILTRSVKICLQPFRPVRGERTPRSARRVALAFAGTAALSLGIQGVMTAPIRAQSPKPNSVGAASGTQLQFDVASIKAASPDAPINSLVASPIITAPGRLSARNASLRDLIRGAYGLEDYQIAGGSASVLAARFDVEAKAAGRATANELRLMLQGLLADRFKLALHPEAKELAVYALTVGKDGPKLPALPTEAESASRRPNRVRLKDLPSLARFLAHYGSDKPVIDQTGLTGEFDLDLDLSGIRYTQASPPGGESSRDGGRDPGNVSDAIVGAVQNQFGLKLPPTKARVEILVVDHAEKPAGN